MSIETNHPMRTGQLVSKLMVAMLLSMIGLWQSTEAAEFWCTSGDVACLIAALTEANANGEENTIALAAGTYTLTAIDNTTDGANGLPSVTSKLTIIGAGADASIIERKGNAPLFRLIHVAAPGTLTLERLTLRGGLIEDTFGAGILNVGGLLTLSKSTVAHNSARSNETLVFGAGIHNHQGTLTITESTIRDNAVLEFGSTGGIFNEQGALTIAQSTISGNTTPGGGASIFNNAGTLQIFQSLIVDNHGGVAGGIISNGLFTLTESTVAENSSPQGTAGGLLVAGVTTITNSTIVNNSGQFGGGIETDCCPVGTLTITSSTIAGNTASVDGGGIYNNAGMLTLINSTLAANMANRHGGGIFSHDINQPTTDLQNTILARNSASEGQGDDCLGQVTSLGNNLLGNPTSCEIALQHSDLTGDPGLGAFTDDGIPGHGYFPLLASSRAINAANDAVCPETDQLWQPRVRICDIGAIEFSHPSVLVNDWITLEPRRSTVRFTPDPTGCPAGCVGKFRFDARLTNTSAHVLTDLFVEVTTLTNGNLLQNADGGPAGVGARLTVPKQHGLRDGILSPDEFVKVPFVICLQTLRPFRFEVDVFGVVNASADAHARALP